MKDSEIKLAQYDAHTEAVNALEAEAAQAGRRLTEADQTELQNLRQEGSAILAAADRASKQETGVLPTGIDYTADKHGHIVEVRSTSMPGSTPEAQAPTNL